MTAVLKVNFCNIYYSYQIFGVEKYFGQLKRDTLNYFGAQKV